MPMARASGGAGQKADFAKVAGEDMSGADGCMSSAEMVALMNNSKLLMQSSSGGNIMQTGANRDADGTIDRSPPPTPEVLAVLKQLKRAIDRYGIDMTSEFRTQGATQYGTITKSRFNSIITTTFGLEKGFLWDDPKLAILSTHYGTGALDLHLKGKMQVAWMDVCEDLGEVDGSFMPAGQAPPLKLTTVPMSNIAKMLDAADGSVDGAVGELTDGMSKGAFLNDHDGW